MLNKEKNLGGCVISAKVMWRYRYWRSYNSAGALSGNIISVWTIPFLRV